MPDIPCVFRVTDIKRVWWWWWWKPRTSLISIWCSTNCTILNRLIVCSLFRNLLQLSFVTEINWTWFQKQECFLKLEMLDRCIIEHALNLFQAWDMLHSQDWCRWILGCNDLHPPHRWWQPSGSLLRICQCIIHLRFVQILGIDRQMPHRNHNCPLLKVALFAFILRMMAFRKPSSHQIFSLFF